MPSTIDTLRLLIAIILTSAVSCQSKEKVTVVEEETKNTEELLPDWITTDYVMGKFNPSEHTDFTLIEHRYAAREGLYLRKEAYAAFVDMWNAAKEDGVDLVIRSATRNFDYQKGIWERKWTGQTTLSDGTKASDISDRKGRAKKILLYSSMPGTSRHHWGTDIDLNSFDNSYFDSGRGKALYDWLTEHGSSFGYCQSYTSKVDGRTGYEEEKWHWTYMPLSKPLTNYCAKHLTNDMIKGFDGDDTPQEIDVLDAYILGINKACL